MQGVGEEERRCDHAGTRRGGAGSRRGDFRRYLLLRFQDLLLKVRWYHLPSGEDKVD